MRTEFQRSSLISTYQLGLIMSDFKCSKTNAYVGVSNATNVSVCAAPDSIGKTEYSLGLSKSIFEFFEAFYTFKFPVPKSGILNNRSNKNYILILTNFNFPKIYLRCLSFH